MIVVELHQIALGLGLLCFVITAGDAALVGINDAIPCSVETDSCPTGWIGEELVGRLGESGKCKDKQNAERANHFFSIVLATYLPRVKSSGRAAL